VPDVTADIRRRSVSHSLSRPRRLFPPPWLDIGSIASFAMTLPVALRGFASSPASVVSRIGPVAGETSPTTGP
jgi:hypothetical protein